MPRRLTKGLVTNKRRQAFLLRLPVFSNLTPAETAELADLMYEIHYTPGECIVAEGDLVDSVYIIAKGKAEVSTVKKTKRRLMKGKQQKIPIAILSSGESIGLNDTGFFSATGSRTATVTAMTDVNVLGLNISDLHQFFKSHPTLQTQMSAFATELLIIKLIKQSLPFSRVSNERLHWLAKHVEEISLSAGSIVFEQGSQGDRSYLIRSGQVEIFVKNDDGSEHHLALLKSPTLFGEATLITHSPRNATARVVADSELLVLEHRYLTELLETENNVGQMLMTLMVDRSKPVQNPHVIAHHRDTADGQKVVILKNPDNGKYFKLSVEGWFIWKRLNGRETMQEITLALADKFDIFAPDVVAALVSKLAKAGFIINVELQKDKGLSGYPFWTRSLMRLQQLLELRIVIGDADKWISSFYQKGGYLLFTRIFELLLACLAIGGFIACILATPHALHVFKSIPHSWVIFLLIAPFTVLSVALHELGHALATKSFGYEVHYMGVGWNGLRPVAFTDTSDMWLSSKRWPRIAVNLAGVFTDVLVAGSASILFFIISNPFVQGLLWLFAIFTYINAFRMLSPLQDLDGYYVLMDLLERPHLRQSSAVWLVKEFPKSWRNRKKMRNYFPEIFYWLSCIVFLILLTLITLLLQTFVFKLLGFKGGPFMALLLPLTIVLLTSLGVISEIRRQSED